MRNALRSYCAVKLYYDLIDAFNLREIEKACMTKDDFERLVTEIMEKVKKS